MVRSRTRPSLYVVRRVSQRTSLYGAEPVVYANSGDRPLSGVPLQGFATKKAAETARKGLERQARESTPVGPFLESLLPEKAASIVEAVRRTGLPPPDLAGAGPPVGPVRRDYGGLTYGQDYFAYTKRLAHLLAEWWAAQAPELSPERNARLWNLLFPDHRFYDVVRVPLEG